MSEPLIQTPTLFGEQKNFLLERELGQGGMGGVYMSHDKLLDRPVAVKVMLKEYGSDSTFVEKFKKEAQAAARLVHPNIAQVYSYGLCDGMPYIAMELVAGGSLYQLMKNAPGKTDVARILKIGEQVAQALRCASDQGFVHGDIKPENILLDSNGNAKIVDFGLAGMQKETDEIWGTPYYISPEKVKKESVDFRADMYSLGGSLYHALTGVAPFEGEDSVAVVKKRFEGAPRKPSEIRPDLTPAVDALLLKMLALNKENRYPSFEALLEAIHNVLTRGLVAGASASIALIGASAPTASETPKPATGGRKPMMVRGRRMTMKRPGGAASVNAADEEAPRGGKAKMPMRRHHGASMAEVGEDEETGGNVGGKVAGVVFGVILLIGGVVGGLVWYQIAAEKARKLDELSQIVKNIDLAKEAVSTTVGTAEKYGTEFEDFAKKATESCEAAAKTLGEKMPEYAAQLKPAETKELVEARQAFENYIRPPDDTNAVAAAETVATNTPAASAPTPKAAPVGKRKIKQFRPPTDEEGDPASPEHEEYLKAKKAFEDAQRAGGEADDESKSAATNDTTAAEKPAEPEAPKVSAEREKEIKDILAQYEKVGPEVLAEYEKKLVAVYAEYDRRTAAASDTVIKSMGDLWERAYGCQASTYRIRLIIQKLTKQASECAELKDETPRVIENLDRLRMVMEKLGALSQDLKGTFEEMKGSKDVETVRKGIAFVKSKGDSTIRALMKESITANAEKNRSLQDIRDEMADKLKRIVDAENKRQLIAKETAAVKEKFDSIVQGGHIRQLNWRNATNQLVYLKKDFQTMEGKLAANVQIHRVLVMKKAQDIIINSAVGYVFKARTALKGKKIEKVNDKEFVFAKLKNKSVEKVSWQNLYKSYPGNVNELFNRFIIKGRDNATPRLTLRGWADAMMGAALTMQLVCPEVNGAMTKGEALAKEVYRSYPEYQKLVKDFFPAIDFEAAAEEDSGSEEKKDDDAGEEKEGE